MPLVSILVPCYNAAPWLAQALDSALAQECDKEIIVVDDGSTDASRDVAQSFASRGVKVVLQPNRGASAARNAALGLSRGDWIQYLDADDLLAPDKIPSQLRAATDLSDAVWTARWARFAATPDDAKVAPTRLGIDSDPAEWLIRKFDSHDMMHPAAWLVPRRVSDRAGRWDERLSLDDDGEYFTRVVLASSGVRHCPEAMSFYRSNIDGSLSHRQTESAQRSALLSLELSCAHLLAMDNSERARKACANMFMRLGQTIYPQFPDLVTECETKARSLGGSNEVPLGGAAFTLLARVFGWRFAKRVRAWHHGRRTP